MTNIYAGFGKIIRIVNKSAEDLGTESNLLELSVSVYTGEKKKNEDDYPQQVIFKLSIWGKYGDVLSDKVEVGNRVAFSGKLGTPEVFEDKEGEMRVNLKLQSMGLEVKLIDRVDEGDSKPAYNPKGATNNKNAKTATKSSTPPSKQARIPNKAKPAVSFDDDDDNDPSTDFFDS